MKVVFFLPELLRSYKEIPSLTVAQFKSYLEKSGFDLSILLEQNKDNEFDDVTGSRLIRECVLKANFLLKDELTSKVIFISSWYYNVPFVLEFIKEYRKTYSDGAVIVLGGYAATNSTKTIFDILGKDIDFIIRGNGYLASKDLLEYISRHKLVHKKSTSEKISIKGVSYICGDLLVDNGLADPIFFNDLPIPDYSFTGNSFIQSLYMKTTDGCGYNHCHFCTSEKFNSYQEKDISLVKDELLEYRKKYGTTIIQFTDNTFLCNESRVKEISRFLKDNGFFWSCYSRIEVNESLLKFILKNNCKKIFFGYDTPNERDFIENDKSKIAFDKYKEKSKKLFLLMSKMKQLDEDFFADFAIIDFNGEKEIKKNEHKKGIKLHKSRLQYIPGTKYYARNPEKFIFDDNIGFFYSKYEVYFRKKDF